MNEVRIDYSRNTSSNNDYDWDSNPNNDRGFGFDNRVSYSNTIKEDYIGLMRRLERLTQTQWNLSPESYYSSYHNKTGYDSFSDNWEETLTFTTEYFASDRKELAKKLDLIEKIAGAFFGEENEVSVDYKDGAIILFVTGFSPYNNGDRIIRGHKNSREIKYGKEYAGYPLHQAKSSKVKDYYHPYPNAKNDGGNYKLANWQRFMNGETPMSYDEWNGGNKNRGYYDDEYEPEPWYDDY